jgi:Bacterial Ig domain/IPT/TIG domain
MFDDVRFTQKTRNKDFCSYALLLFCICSLGLAGCSGFVNASGGNSGGTPAALAISSVQAATPTTSGFQVIWSTNVAANSAVDYGTSASYGSSTPVNSTMVTSHQLALTSLTIGTLYHFRVRSTDANGNNAASQDMTFATAGDTIPPTVSITSPAANATLAGSVIVAANATDNIAVASVQFKVDNANTGAAITSAPYNYSLNTTTLSNGNHIITALAADTSGNTATSSGVAVKVNNTSTTVPSITSLNPMSGLVGTSVTIAGANFGTTQGSSTVTFNGVAATPTGWSATSITAPVPNGATTGNVVVTVGGVASNGVSFTVQADTTPPTVPTGLTATAISSSQINLTWTASTDNVGVKGYNVYRGGVKIGTTPSTSYLDGGLNASTSYTYNVSAYDAAGNTSAQSAGASATTQAASSGGGIPSALGWYQIPNTKIAPNCPTDPSIQAVEGCSGVVADWSSGVGDTKRNRLLVWGGGHNGYYGNEVYALDLNSLTMSRITGWTSNPTLCTTAPEPDGKPNSRHTYDGLSYIAHADQFFAVGGSVSCPAGMRAHDSWTMDLTSDTWTSKDPHTGGTPATNFGSLGEGMVSDYDPNTKLVFVHDDAQLWSYNYDTNTYALLNSYATIDYHLTAVVDPKRKLFVALGASQAHKFSIAPGSTYSKTDFTLDSSCGALVGAQYPGLAYDSVQDRIVGWTGGDTVYLLNLDTNTCTTATYPNGPGAAQGNGTFKRFRYFPALNIFAVVNSVNQNAYSLRLTSGGGTGGGSGPVISGISISGITTIGATVSWTTDVAATTQVEYGTTTAYGALTTLNSSLVTSHTQPLIGLALGTLYHYRVHSKNSAGTETISGDAVFSTNSTTDTTPPTVAMTAPASGATVSGTVTVSANASDNVGVANVQFTLDGANLGAALTASPYQVSWDTTTASNAAHMLSAVAKDAAGNAATATPVPVTVSNSGSTALQDFQSRCATAGVIVCEGFDSASEFVPAANPSTGLYPGNDNSIDIVQDTSTYASGGGSLHFPIKADDGTGATVRDDNWLQTFCSAHPPAPCTPTVFGQNSTFYVQFRYRVDTAYATTNWEDPVNGGSSPKIADFAYHSSSCGQTEITTNNRNGTDKPMMYTGCGARGFFVDPNTTNWNNSAPPYQWQNGYYNCSYPSTPSGPGGCFTMPANTWMTFYYRVQLGTWSQPNSHITAWVAPDGQPLQKFVEVSNMTLFPDMPGYDAIWFNVYMTNFSGAATNPAANAWLDEVIVSSAPVPAPSANGGGIPQ